MPSHPSATDPVTSARLMVGMEVHVELATRTKMFTSAPNVAHPDYHDSPPNSLCDPVVIGLPGSLPVMNRMAVEMSVRVGLALGCRIARHCKWDRKSYYYPDLPKNYQISQYDRPLCEGGALEFDVPRADGTTHRKTVRILRAHLEEDAGKLLHEAPGGLAIEHSIVDLNRAGTPLLEIVTRPDIASADEAVAFAQNLRDLCRHLGVTEGVLQRGHIRFEPNINVVIESGGQTFKTPIVEIKNLNSFRALHGSITHEFGRQIEEWRRSGVVGSPGTKSTRGWDDATQTTFLQREKEEAHDYRYFPDPDLVPVEIDEAWLGRIGSTLSEGPAAKRQRYTGEFGIGPREAEQLLDEPRTTRFFEAVVALGVDPRRACALVLNNLARRANERSVAVDALGITPEQVAAIDGLVRASTIGSGAADTLIGLCCAPGMETSDPGKLAREHGLVQVSDDAALEGWCRQAMAANPKSVEAVRGGKQAAIGALVGAVMKLSGGKANAQVVGQMLRRKLLEG